MDALDKELESRGLPFVRYADDFAIFVKSEAAARRVYARGWLSYFALEQVKSTLRDLDKWLRRRVRACYWRQWSKSKTRLRKLVALGLPKRVARGSAMSGKGPRRLSMTAGVQRALSNEYLTEVGLFNLESYWESFAPLRRTAGCGPACPVV